MNNEFRFLLYKVEQEDVSVDALVKDETIWLTQKAMAELFDIDKSGISRHLKNIFERRMLDWRWYCGESQIGGSHRTSSGSLV